MDEAVWDNCVLCVLGVLGSLSAMGVSGFRYRCHTYVVWVSMEYSLVCIVLCEVHVTLDVVVCSVSKGVSAFS